MANQIIDKALDYLGNCDHVIEEGSNTVAGGALEYRKWKSGNAEIWFHIYSSSGITTTAWTAPIYYADSNTWANIWAGIFNTTPSYNIVTSNNSQFISIFPYTFDANGITSMRFVSIGAKTNAAYAFSVYAFGTWK